METPQGEEVLLMHEQGNNGRTFMYNPRTFKLRDEIQESALSPSEIRSRQLLVVPNPTQDEISTGILTPDDFAQNYSTMHSL